MAREWVKLQLDVTTFDDEKFEPYLNRCRERGIELTTMADVGDTPGNRTALYELNKECSADIPDRGVFYTLDEYFRERIDAPTYDPRGVVIALDNNRWVGMSAISDCHEKGYVFNEMTGVKRDFRSMGVAMSMKVVGVKFVRECGVDIVRTVHHPRNESIIVMNKKLGYVEGNWDYR